MPIYVRPIKSAILPDMWVANTDYPAKRFNATASGKFNATAPALDGVYKDNEGNIYEIRGNIIRYVVNGRWGAWQLNPKYEEFTGEKNFFNANAELTYKRTGRKDANGNIVYGPWVEVSPSKKSFTGGKKLNATAGNLDGVFKDKEGNTYEVKGNIIRYVVNGRWGEWKLNPKFEEANFTGDTGGTLNWQIGLEDPPYYGLFGSKKKETKAREDAMRDARRDHPPVTTCDGAIAGIASVRAHIASTEQSIQSGGTGANIGPRYLEAYNTVLQEYINYFNTNCVSAPPPDPGPVRMPPILLPPIKDGGPSINHDPIAQTALPGVNTPPSQTGTGALEGGGFTQTVTIPAGTKKFTAPKWAWYVGGGLLLVIIFLGIKKLKGKSA